MDRLIHTAVSGMSAAMTRQRVVASNMANAQTIGFRAETMESTPMTIEGATLEVRAMNHTGVRGAQMRPGALIATGRELDVAMTGDAMLTVQAPDGGEGYTRRGDLAITPTGLLQTGEGLALIGDNGPVTVPLGAKITIAPDGTVMAGNPAAPDAPPAPVARLKLANWRGSQLEKDLTGLFRVPGGNDGFGVLPADADARLVNGTLEQSNVDPAGVLVEMIEAQRMFDLRTKVIATARDLDEGSASLMRINL